MRDLTLVNILEIDSSAEEVAQLSVTNPHYALHHDKRQNFKTVT